MTKVAADTPEASALVGSCPNRTCHADLIWPARNWSKVYCTSLKASTVSTERDRTSGSCTAPVLPKDAVLIP
jgi:hypothetical protein